MRTFPILAIMTLFMGAFVNSLLGRKNAKVRNVIVFFSMAVALMLMALMVKPVFFDGQIITYWMGGWAPEAGWAYGIGLEVDALSLFFGLIVTIAVMVSGALSGIGGMSFAYSISASFSPAIYLGFGYLAIAALIFGNWSILPTLYACLLFGLARSSGQAVIHHLGLPSAYNDLIRILPYVITLFLLIFFARNSRAPRALGKIYDKGKR